MADYLIYGLGRSGRGVARFLAREGLAAEWVDARPAEEDLRLTQELGFGRGDVSRTYRTVVAAPGVPIDHPDLVALRARGAEVIGELELAFRRRAVPIIGVTGTAGKGGTSVLIQQLLAHLGVRAHLGGNFDPPLLDVIDGAEVAVCEISSFQLERVQDFRPVVGVITNLGVDHLDRHGSVEAYHAAKLNLARRMTPQDTLVLPAGVNAPSAATTVRFDGAHLVNLDGEAVLSVADVPEGHHPANVAAALLAAEAFLRSCGRAVPVPAWAEAVRAAKPVPGRFETVARAGGVAFVEDSIATRTIAVQAALTRARGPVAWLVGGIDKGADLAALEGVVREKVARVVAFGQDGPAFAGYFDAACGVPVTLVPGADAARVMADAVRAAYASLPGEGTVLLAPIGTSFDLWRDYKARGAAFADAARALVAEVQP
ncbi:UDP-N-acetylmuramoyl-L-alanine--D-glutamate ligase [Deinococcus maricopensis]|uniref:UDP-N-acetylmuramoylalanine--D-glutamate ligase n=1 Tax=Deinococcus maricopensis (strain DSM 21211 / LMG 22137 / NRRL B-23946 / LB-34) TaxID=709986 RepID=E8U8B1_DEIML|nr:UDP-N-acetylmuramoyl-L-alanine--D-glutamate ligase [Deinococcus maricopensis]ADV67300.1 UDP-N-acetylmuramoylalanine--D-glutamate ligase [Deinococcus maricopensis DSM 21211]